MWKFQEEMVDHSIKIIHFLLNCHRYTLRGKVWFHEWMNLTGNNSFFSREDVPEGTHRHGRVFGSEIQMCYFTFGIVFSKLFQSTQFFSVLRSLSTVFFVPAIVASVKHPTLNPDLTFSYWKTRNREQSRAKYVTLLYTISQNEQI